MNKENYWIGLIVGLILGMSVFGIVQLHAAVTTSTYSAQFDRANDPIFLKKVEQAILTAAVAVRAEGTNVVGWYKRSQLAMQVLQSPTAQAVLFAKGVAANVAINDSSLDSDILFTVQTNLWNPYAGVGL